MELVSIFKDEINLLIKYERAMGFKKNNEENYKKLDTYFVKINKNKKDITINDYYDFIYNFKLIPNIKTRYLIIRTFAKFLLNNNFINIFYEDINFGKDNIYEPHLYTEDEMKKIFNIEDSNAKDDIKKVPFSILFRLLFSTGIRIGEALKIRIYDIDFNNKSIKIMHSKYDNNRMIFLSNSMYLSLKNYLKKINLKKDDNLFLDLSESKCLKEFKMVVNKANLNIDHVVLHDLRHSFAVNAFRKFLNENNQNYEETYAYLHHYLGHLSTTSTEYYLHMTNEDRKEIINASIISMENGHE